MNILITVQLLSSELIFFVHEKMGWFSIIVLSTFSGIKTCVEFWMQKQCTTFEIMTLPGPETRNEYLGFMRKCHHLKVSEIARFHYLDKKCKIHTKRAWITTLMCCTKQFHLEKHSNIEFSRSMYPKITFNTTLAKNAPLILIINSKY